MSGMFLGTQCRTNTALDILLRLSACTSVRIGQMLLHSDVYESVLYYQVCFPQKINFNRISGRLVVL